MLRLVKLVLRFGLLSVLGFSCINNDILNISDSVEIRSSYSVPVGPVEFNINSYLESLDTVTYPWPDTLSFNDVLYPNIATAVNYTSIYPFVFNLVSDPEVKVKTLEFIVIITNGYPTAISAQVCFLANGSLVPVDSVFAGGPLIVQPALLDSEGVVTEPSEVIVTVAMPAGFIPLMPDIAGIMVKCRVETTRPDMAVVKFYDEYDVKIHIATRIGLQYNTGDL